MKMSMSMSMKPRKARPQLVGSFEETLSSKAKQEQESAHHESAHKQEEEEEDPLDAFMSENSAQLESEARQLSSGRGKDLPEIVSGETGDAEDAEEIWKEQKQSSGEDRHESHSLPLAFEDDFANRKGEKVVVEALPPVDHSKIAYSSFRKDFWTAIEHNNSINDQDKCKDKEEEARLVRDEMQLQVTGRGVIPPPVASFSQMSKAFPNKLIQEIVRQGFEAPTAIQSQAIPVILSGRDVIALAKTGSGKTLSFLWPLIVHIVDQPNMQTGDGPIALVLTPTRYQANLGFHLCFYVICGYDSELSEQIYREAKKFGKIFNIRSCAVFGGEGKWQMAKALREWPEIVVATPGRLIDMISSGATNMRRCTMAVVDECDRMFEMGFEHQVKSILQHISATLKRKVEIFAREAVRDPVRLEVSPFWRIMIQFQGVIQVGSREECHPDIQQVIEVLPGQGHKWPWLMCRIQECLSKGLVLIFVNGKADSEDVAKRLQEHLGNLHSVQGGDRVEVGCLHGDKQQSERSEVMRRFKTGQCRVLVATDVASRGLDIKDVRTVINYDGAKSLEVHTHRIGRTGRMGVDGVAPGTAYTLLVDLTAVRNADPRVVEASERSDASLAVELVRSLQRAGQEHSISQALLKLAQSSARWHEKPRQGHGLGETTGAARRGAGLGHGQQAVTSAQLSAMTSRAPKGCPEGVVNKLMGQSIEQKPQSQAAAAPKRKNRFSALFRGEDDSQGFTSSTSSSPALPGFVAAERSSSYCMSQQNDGSSGQDRCARGMTDPTSKKRSRWD